jgi:hypothetical protein
MTLRNLPPRLALLSLTSVLGMACGSGPDGAPGLGADASASTSAGFPENSGSGSGSAGGKHDAGTSPTKDAAADSGSSSASGIGTGSTSGSSSGSSTGSGTASGSQGSSGQPSEDTLPAEFAQVFSASPLLTKLADLKYSVVQSPLSGSIWSTEVFASNVSVTTGIPVYVSSNPSDMLVTVSCNYYGGHCVPSGTKVHVNPDDLIQKGSDHHILLIDPSLSIEMDCWQALALNGSQSSSSGDLRPDLSTGVLQCGWGGVYALGSTGLAGSYANEASSSGEGIHFGPAAGEFMITPSELLRGRIDHALALNSVCLNSPDVYPADNRVGTDKSCDGTMSYPHYGDAIMYVGATDAEIAASSHSAACKAVLTAMHDYGAYFSDTGDNVTRLDVISADAYTSDPGEMGANLWPSVYADLAAAGDGDSSGNWTSCMNGLSNTDFDLVELTPP